MLRIYFKRFEAINRCANTEEGFRKYFGGLLEGIGTAARIIENADRRNYDLVLKTHAGLFRFNKLKRFVDKCMQSVDIKKKIDYYETILFLNAMEKRVNRAKALILISNILVLAMQYKFSEKAQEMLNDHLFLICKSLVDDGILRIDNEMYKQLLSYDRKNPSSCLIETIHDVDEGTK